MHEDEIPVGRAKDLRGQKFGMLTVLYRVQNQGKNVQWKCQCDCGNIIVATAGNLRSGNTKGCGCKKGVHIKDISGQRFGRLVAIKPTTQVNSKWKWLCKCDCGNITIVPTGHLNNGHTSSCGCAVSKGELKIIELLQKYNISFETQKHFNQQYPSNLGTGRAFRFDFFVSKKYLIEYDGQQHFKPIEYFGGEKQFKIQQERDVYKNQ